MFDLFSAVSGWRMRKLSGWITLVSLFFSHNNAKAKLQFDKMVLMSGFFYRRWEAFMVSKSAGSNKDNLHSERCLWNYWKVTEGSYVVIIFCPQYKNKFKFEKNTFFQTQFWVCIPFWLFIHNILIYKYKMIPQQTIYTSLRPRLCLYVL